MTAQLYLALGFAPLPAPRSPLFESSEIWGPENAALILITRLVKRLGS